MSSIALKKDTSELDLLKPLQFNFQKQNFIKLINENKLDAALRIYNMIPHIQKFNLLSLKVEGKKNQSFLQILISTMIENKNKIDHLSDKCINILEKHTPKNKKTICLQQDDDGQNLFHLAVQVDDNFELTKKILNLLSIDDRGFVLQIQDDISANTPLHLISDRIQKQGLSEKEFVNILELLNANDKLECLKIKNKNDMSVLDVLKKKKYPGKNKINTSNGNDLENNLNKV